MAFQSISSYNSKNTIHKNKVLVYLTLLILCVINTACIKKINLYKGDKDDENGKNKVYERTVVCETDFFYPFEKESKQIKNKITIHTHNKLPEDIANMRAEIPPLKYNKSWLFMLTQDDCKQVAFCCTWAAINGQPLSDAYFYDLVHVQEDDFPPDAYYLGKTLGCTDGAGNEVRFSFTTTLSPEWEYMDGTTKVGKGYTENYHRFFMKSGLFWGNVKEMLNYGVGIAIHDLKIDKDDKDNEASILSHLNTAHNIILNKLGRNCKMLARPDGNNTYISAGQKYAPIQTMTTESGGFKLYPSQSIDLFKEPIERSFYNSLEELDKRSNEERIQEAILEELSKPDNKRSAIYIGVHGTDRGWVNLLLWLNDQYGKDGLDNMWMPNQEDYFEYAYYRRHAWISLYRIDDYTLELSVDLPGDEAFYYPSITINLSKIEMDNISSIDTDDNITGFSYAACKEKEGIMLNIDCRKYLAEHAENFVKRYEANPTNASAKADANYFVNMLKDSDKKTELKKRAE